jgi:membrane-associated phospholipid phosphatase
MQVALFLSALLIVIALLSARLLKLSLHVAFAAFATLLLWSLMGIAVSAALVWSRLVLGRHVTADVVAGVVLGAVAGVAYQVAISWLRPG